MQNNLATAPYMLSDRHFMAMLLAVCMLHMATFVVWHFAPKQKITDVPIRTLNVRLGDAEDMTETLEIQQQSISSAQAIQAIDAFLTAPSKPAPTAKTVDKKPADGAKQFVREVNSPSVKKSAIGGKKGEDNAKIMSRYTQLISLWTNKFLQYPEEARAAGIQGNAQIRIRIDRRGNVRYYSLERSSGNDALDQAALNMIRRANPVPAVPADFETGELIEIIIPVKFSFDEKKS